MSSRIRFVLSVAAFCFVPAVRANNLAYVKCAANQDRVWVYDSLSSFDVEAKLRCGEPVEILSRINGFVKIRTESGVDGYIPDSALPDLPALPDETKRPLASAAAQSLAAARKNTAPANSAAVSANPVASTAASASASAKPALPAESNAPVSHVAPTNNVVALNTPAEISNPAPSAPTNASAKVVISRSHSKSVTAAQKKPPVHATKPSAPAVAAVTSVPAMPVPPPPVRPAIETVSASPRDTAVEIPATATFAAKDDEDSDEYPDTKPQNESGDPACRVFFAAYGLAPSQFKWMAENRRKEFAGICPAPDLAHVDYVVLFTHDFDSYNYAMPVPVHTDRNGFSDFSPLTTFDTALISASEIEKTRYEYVWVFHVKRGAFDPARFSPRRKPQFVTYAKGSHASSRAIEDGFSFVENQVMNR